MIQVIRRFLPVVLVLTAVGAQAQFHYYSTHHGSVSVGGTGVFNTQLNYNPDTTGATVNSPSGPQQTGVSNQQQFTTDSVGFVTAFQFHPVAWAGVELNYGFTHNSEKYAFNYAVSSDTTSRVTVPTDQHEFTGGYLFHPRHIPFQPFVVVGGGAVDFAPSYGSNQWRGAGLLEVGFDLPTPNKHIGFRVEGRSLYYRQPNFYTPAISTQSWRVQEEPSISAVYKF